MLARKKIILSMLLIMLMIPALTSAFTVTSPFGWRVHPISGEWQFHKGIDIAEEIGCPVLALFEGEVVAAGEYVGYGNAVVLRHINNTYTLYGHCDQLYVKQGQAVHAGDTIAAVGSSGASTGSHLHLELWVNGEYVDPMIIFTEGKTP